MSDHIIHAVAFLVLALAAFLGGVFVTRGSRNDTAEKPQALLRAGGENKSTPVAVEQRQAALHKTVLDSKPIHVWRWRFLLLPLILAGAATSLDAWLMPQKQLPAAKKMAAPSPQNNAVAPVRPGGDLEIMTKRLADRLQREPGDGQGWALLARAYTEMREYSMAETAFAKAAALLPPDPSLSADWANAHVMARGGQWDEQALDLVGQALAADPKHLKALSLAGSAALHRGDRRLASEYWTRMKAAAPPDSPEAREADANLNELNTRLREKLLPPDNGVGWIENSVKQRRN